MHQIVIGALIALLVPAAATAADDSVADFYKGKTITILVGSTPGGGYDGDARLVARNIGRHIPGNPAVIVQNMPGARGLAAANSLYNIAKRDGTFMGLLERVHLIDAYLIPDGIRYDERKFNWLGSIGSEQGVAFSWHTSPYKVIDDIRKAEFIVGGYSNSATLPPIYNSTMGTKFKVIKGYSGSETVLLAMQKGEVQGIANYSTSNLLTKHPDWIRDHKINILFQTGSRKEAGMPDVPSAFQFALTEEKRQVLDLWLAPSEVARPLAMPPEVPRERLDAVRQAFLALFQDQGFLADARKAGVAIDPKDGAYIHALVLRLRAYPEKVIEAARAAAAE
jgi:tripartite-type tricarboxylate transporter receptor subunit TctC